MEMSALAWLELSVAFWANDELDNAVASVDKAIDALGGAEQSAVEQLGTPQRIAICYAQMMRSAVLAHVGRFDDSIESIGAAARFGAGVVPDLEARLGGQYLINARVDKDAARRDDNLKIAAEKLTHGDGCPGCLYARSCVLAKLAESVSGEKQRTAITKAEEKMVEFLRMCLEHIPLKLDLSAVASDPFLALVIKSDRVRAALSEYETDWVPRNGSLPPLWELWDSTPPLDVIKFSR